MAGGVNKAILVGHLGKDPEVRHLESGVAVANFTMATTESYKDKTTGERKELTEWHNIVLWRGLADIAAKYLHKGDMVYIEGRLRTRSWEKDGVTRYITEIVADNLTMMSPKPGGRDHRENTPSPAPSKNSSEDYKAPDPAVDDLPF